MEPLGKVIPRLWRFPGWQTRLRAGKILARWEEIVGAAVARAARPRAFSQGKLVVEVQDSVWMTRLRFEERHILRLLNEAAGEKIFLAIRWSLARKPFPKNKAPEKDSKSTALPTFCQEKAQKEVAIIEDPEVREAFLRLRLTLLAKRIRRKQKGYKACPDPDK